MTSSVNAKIAGVAGFNVNTLVVGGGNDYAQPQDAKEEKNITGKHL